MSSDGDILFCCIIIFFSDGVIGSLMLRQIQLARAPVSQQQALDTDDGVRQRAADHAEAGLGLSNGA